MISYFKGKEPLIDSSAFVAKDAVIIGDVEIGEKSNIWFKTVIRGDVEKTTIGKNVNIQDLCLIHQSPNLPVRIEDGVSIGHQVTIHACTIRKNALIGMGAIVLDGAEIGESSFIGAGSIVTPGTKIPPNTLAFGSPARVIRNLTDDDIDEMRRVRDTYVERGQYYKNELKLNK